jgi:hypothetical protein
MAKYIEVVFDGRPGRHMPRFVEVEDENGFCATTVGKWFERGLNGYWGLRISADDIERWDPRAHSARIKATRSAGSQAK